MLLETPSRVERGYSPEDAEERRCLVKRIITSPAFSRSNRLSHFLKYVYSLAEKGRFDDIHEQNIGSAVFGRTRDYDPAADSIVRSHASRLRHRLKKYFEEEGQNEPLILTIPRGSYIPAFEPRSQWKPVTENSQTIVSSEFQDVPALQHQTDTHETGPAPVPALGEDPNRKQETGLESRKTIARLRIALIAAAALIAVLAMALFMKHPFASRAQQEESESQNPLWKEFMTNAGARTVVVSSDSGLVMHQHLTGQPVTLASYVNGDYLKNTASPLVSEEIVRKFGTRRYTPAVDLSVLDRITRIFGGRHDHLSFRYARDLRMEDLKQGNAILLGSSESNPWVQLYEPSLNFHFEDDLLHDKAQMVNRNPLPGEAAHYDSTPQDAAPTIYGIVAYRPNLQTSGHVLILEGQTMAGTQTAADFIFDDAYLLPFLKKIRKADGSVPYFEVLLRSRSLGGQSSRLEVIAYRVEKE